MPRRKPILMILLTLIAITVAWRFFFPPRPLRSELESLDNIALDSRHLAWGFNFEPAVVSLDGIINSALSHETVSSLSRPDLITPDQVSKDQLLTSGTWVAGVVVNGQARAYPNTLLLAHECINDELGGEPIAVTYQGISDGLVAFSRRVDGRVLEFGASGLIYHSSLLLYDRQSEPHERSLWSQIERRAITGPAAGQTLRMLDVERMSLIAWLAEHPDTTIVSHNTGNSADYFNDRMALYYVGKPLMFPPDKKRKTLRIAPSKAAVVLVRAGENERAYLLRDIIREGGSIVDQLGGAPIEITLTEGAFERRVRWAAMTMLLLKHLPFGMMTLQFDTALPYTALRRMRVQIKPAGSVTPDRPIARAFMLWHVWEAIYPDGDYYRSKFAGEFEAENAMEDEEPD